MGKRRESRDRRVPADPNRDRQRTEPAAREDRRSGKFASDRRLMVFFFSALVLLPIFSVIVYRIKHAVQATDKLLSVYDRSLVRPNVNHQEILAEHSKVLGNTSHRLYTYPVLAYITPWNSRGYELAKRFSSKITHVSPVWYDLKSDGTKLVLDGRHNADKGWMSDLRMNGHALVLPRVVLEAFPKEFLRKKKQRDKAIDLIVTECREMGYDGIVLESWSRWAAYGVLHDPGMRTQALQFIKQLGDALHAVNSERNPEHYLQLIYVIGPPHSRNLQTHDFGPEDLQILSNDVDGFSLMTYDFSGPQNPGPNAPLKWIQSTLQLLLHTTGSDPSIAYKTLLGINFYGNDFVLSEGFGGGGAITGKEYLSLLEKQKPVLQWDENSAEHMFVYFDDKRVKHAVFYPSLMSISKRLEEARRWGVGISIWEIGQGEGEGVLDSEGLEEAESVVSEEGRELVELRRAQLPIRRLSGIVSITSTSNASITISIDPTSVYKSTKIKEVRACSLVGFAISEAAAQTSSTVDEDGEWEDGCVEGEGERGNVDNTVNPC